MFINISNHPSPLWGEEQRQAAEQWGAIVDEAFPTIDGAASSNEVSALAVDYAGKIMQQYKPGRDVVHIMGEMTFTYALVCRLRAAGFECVASTTQRIKQQMPDGSFISEFRFQAFRNYE